MRHLNTPRRGLTLIELMATLAISVILFGMAAPYLGDYMVNTRLREAGNALLAESLFAQGEALKRNVSTRFIIDGGEIQVRDMSAGGDGVLLRRRLLGDGLSAHAGAQIDFSSRGTPLPFGTATSIDIDKSGVTCSAEQRCPGLRVDGGGGIRLCANRLDCS
jgi:type IV fimbrial biogenesis protein FimT